MLLLVGGLLIFLGVHLVPTSVGLRDGMVATLGAGAYKGAFALLSLLGLVLIVLAFRQLEANPALDPQIWYPPAWTKHAAFALMLPAMILLVASQIPSRIRDVTKHPMLTGIKLWAIAHLIANGSLAVMLLAGGFLLYAGYDRMSVKVRAASGPLGTRTGGIASDILVVVLGVALYAFMLVWGHAHLIGRVLLPSLA